MSDTSTPDQFGRKLGEGQIGSIDTPLPEIGVSPETLAALNSAADDFYSKIDATHAARDDLNAAVALTESGLALAKQITDTVLPLVQSAVTAHQAKASAPQPSGLSKLTSRIQGISGQASGVLELISTLKGSLGF